MLNQQVSRGWALLVMVHFIFRPALSVLFTVEAERTVYKSKFGANVVMGCRFNPLQSLNNLHIAWNRKGPGPMQQVIRIDNQVEQVASPYYEGRVKVPTDQLKEGWAKLQISSLRINDSGTYQCLVHTEEEGGDYKTISLSVVAPFETVSKRVEKTAEADRVVLSCRSEGYPKSSVVWLDGHEKTHTANTTAAATQDELFSVASRIQVSATERNNYTCRFTNDGASATFQIPDEIPAPRVKKEVLVAVLSVGVMMLLLTAAVLTYRRRKGFDFQSTRNLLPGGPHRSTCPTTASPQIVPRNDSEFASYEDERISV